MIAVILCSIFVGIAITLIAQIVFLRKWFFSLPIEGPPWKPQTERYTLPKELKEVLRDPDLRNKKESCVALNLLFQFLFREIKDTELIRRWVMQRMQIEFTEMLQTTTGKLLEQITVREFNLGETFPIIKSASVNKVVIKEENLMEELTFLVDLTYNGGFQLAIDVNMMFGKSASLSVKVTKIQGMARLQFSRDPYTHWSFAFIEDPIMEFDVKSHFEGRPMPQITSLIMNQIRRSVRKKHTLPNYKIRYKPFFRKPEPKPPPKDIFIHGRKLCQGHLEVTVVECNRLVMLSGDGELYVTLALDSVPWRDVVSIRQKLWVAHEAEVVRNTSQNIGLTFREEFVFGRYEEMVAIETVEAGSPASHADLRQNDIVVSVGGVKVTGMKHASKLIKQSADRFTVKVERSSSLKSLPQHGVSVLTPASSAEEVKVEDSSVSLKSVDKNDSARSTDSDDFVNITLPVSLPPDSVSRDSTSSDDLSMNSSPRKGFSILSGSSGLFHRKKGKDNSSSSQRGSPEVKEKVEHKTANESKSALSPATDIATNDDSNVEGRSENKTVQSDELNATPAPCVSSITPSTRRPSTSSDAFHLKKTRFVRSSKDPIFKETFSFEVEEKHAYLHVCVWCHVPEKLDKQQRVIKPEKDVLLGYVSVTLMQTALECISTIQGDVQHTYKLQPGNVKPVRSKIASHPGYDEQQCYGDITLHFQHAHHDISNTERKTINRVKQMNEKAEEEQKKAVVAEPSNIIKRKIDTRPEGKHDFISTHFQSVTYCNFCHKKIWLKTAFQCCVCAMVCHKKCTEKCQAQTKCVKGGYQQKEGKQGSPTMSKKLPHINKEVPDGSPGPPQRTGFLSKLRGKDGSPKLSAMAKGARPKVTVRTASPEPPSDRKRHNSVPDVDKDLSERVCEEGGVQNEERLAGGDASLPRTRSSSTLEDLIKQNASPSIMSSQDGQNSGSEPTSSADSTDTEDDDDELNLLKFYERQKAACSQNADELVVTAAKEMGRELYANLSPEQRRDKLDNMISKLQQEIDQESENRAELARYEREVTSMPQKAAIRAKIEKSDEKVQSLALLMLHYCAGLQHCMEQRELEEDMAENSKGQGHEGHGEGQNNEDLQITFANSKTTCLDVQNPSGDINAAETQCTDTVDVSETESQVMTFNSSEGHDDLCDTGDSSPALSNGNNEDRCKVQSTDPK